jgi:L-asparaginase
MTGCPDVTVLATGGTIDKVYALSGALEVGPPAAGRLLDLISTDLRVDVQPVLQKDSLDITDADRRLLAGVVDRLVTRAVVITHGTDRLTETAEYLAGRRLATVKTVVMTGALQPAAMARTDAGLNLGGALVACQVLPPGIFVCMSGRVFRAGDVRKNVSTGRFESKRSSASHDRPRVKADG